MSLPDKFHISWKNLAAAVKNSSGVYAAVTLASTVAAESAYPLTNCQNANANEPTVIDMTGETTLSITDTDSPDVLVSINCFALHNHNFPDGTTARFRVFDAINQGGTTVYDSAAIDTDHTIPWGSIIAGIDPVEGNFEEEGHMKTHFSKWFDTVQCKSFQLDITNAAGFTNDQLSLDKLWIGFSYATADGPVFGYGSEMANDSEHQSKPGGGMETVEHDVRRSLVLQFKGVKNAERHVLRHIFDRARMGGDLLITMDPNDVKSMNYELTSIYRRMNSNRWNAQHYNWNNMGLALEEN